MKITPANSDAFIKAPQENIRSFLLYGPDTGLVSTRCRALGSYFRSGGNLSSDNSLPTEQTDIDYATIKNDPALLGDTLYATSMFASRLVIRITNIPNSVNKDILSMLTEYDGENIIILEAGELTAASSIRKKAESLPSFASIACYKDDERSLMAVINASLREQGLSAASGVVQMLAQQFEGDRLVVINEIEKLALYMGDETLVQYEDVQACIVNSAESSLDSICIEIASFNPENARAELQRAFAEGVSSVAVIRSLMRYFDRLHIARTHKERGLSDKEAMNALRPPVFFKQANGFSRQMNHWSTAKLQKVLSALGQLEVQCKSTGYPDELLCLRFATVCATRARG